MQAFVILLRGINVGGKNKISMAELKQHLEKLGVQDVVTYINSGNVLLRTDMDASKLGTAVEAMLSNNFALDSSTIRVLCLTKDQMQAVVDHKPPGFGDHPDTYHSDVIFLMGVTAQQVLPAFKPRDGVDTIWPGDGVVYSQRVSELRTKSRLNQVMSSPHYKSMTIRNWNTTTKLLALMNTVDSYQQ